VDARSLGLFRVVFGLVLFWTWAGAGGSSGFGTRNSGLLPNTRCSGGRRPGGCSRCSFTLSSEYEAQVGFVLCAAAYAMFRAWFTARGGRSCWRWWRESV